VNDNELSRARYDAVTAGRLAWQVLRRHRLALVAGVLLMLLARGAALLLPASTKFIYDDVITRGRSELLLPLAAGILGVTILIAGTSYLLTLILSVSAQRTVAEMRVELQRRVLHLPLQRHEQELSGTFAARVLLDPEAVTNLVGTGVIQLVGGLLSAALGMLVLLYLDWRLALGTLLLLCAFALVSLVLLMRLRPLVRQRASHFATLSGRLNELFAGIRTVRAHATEAHEQDHFAANVSRLRDMTATSLLRVSQLSALTIVTAGALGVIIMIVGGQAVLAGRMTAGELLWFATTVAFVARPLQTVASAATQLTQALAGLDRVSELSAMPVETFDDPAREPVHHVAGDIAFEHVGFAYPTAGTMQFTGALHDVNLRAPAGSVVAIVGSSGAGKSTLLSLLLGLYRPTAGRILIDGRDLHSLRLSEYRKHIGAVLQDPCLFAGTIRDNIAFARPAATDDEVREAARIAQAHAFIARLPGGYGALVGERGVRLSAGQRQRIAIARALLSQPRVLILDEATAHLDPHTEQQVLSELKRFRAGRTTFIIAHDMRTTRGADQILVLEAGRMVQHVRGEASERPLVSARPR
jgi:ABC-type bacteriocin/lantibiotic exporter with double-glycine peptidase domain